MDFTDCMNILFDNRWSGDHGIGRFSKEISSRMDNVNFVPSIGYPSSPYDSIFLAWQIQKVKPDMFFSPGYNPPITSKNPFVFTLCDLNHLRTKENSTALKRAYYELIIKPACHRAQKIITISDFSKAEIIQWTGVKEEKVINVGVGVNEEFSPNGIKKEFELPYILYIGNNKPHKNLKRLIGAFGRSAIATNTLLLLSGSPTAEISKQINASPFKENIRFIGFINEAELPSIYRGALGLAYPSTYEGFGLPVLEALACGTPVLTSNTTALPEVASGAAILIDPYSIDDISQGLNQLISNNSQRNKNILRGLEKAKSYSWQKTADKVQTALLAA